MAAAAILKNPKIK